MFFIISFIFGILFGSFISVLITRIKSGKKGILLGRSECTNCNHKLSPSELIPIVSYLLLKGRCKNCKNKISIIYPILEIITGLIFVFLTFLVLKTGNLEVGITNINIIIYTRIIGIFLVAIAFYDILYFEISYILCSICIILLVIPQVFGIIGNLKIGIILAISGFLGFLFISKIREILRKIEGLGGGDAIGAAIIGIGTPILVNLLNLEKYPIWISFYILLLMGFMIGAIFGIFVLIFGKNKSTKIALPFLPFMLLAIILFSFIGKNILDFIVF